MTDMYPKYIFSREQKTLYTVSRRLSVASDLMLFLDYDGTLTPIRKTPSEAILSRETKHLLVELSRLPGVQVSIITGRSMRNIQRLVPLKQINFAANHGLHIRYNNGTEWIHMDATASMPALMEVRKKLHRSLKSIPRVFVENKQLTLSIHYRNTPSVYVPSLKNAVTNIVYSIDPILRVTRGKKVLEIRPPTLWGKSGAAVEMLRAHQSPDRQLSIYIGDDTTDEDAFQVLQRTGITIRVGKSIKTKAKYYLKDVKEVFQFLELIQKIRKPKTS